MQEKEPLPTPNIFDAKIEIKKIRKAKIEDRPRMLSEFKEKFGKQLRGLAKMETELLVKIRSNPDVSEEELEKIALLMSRQFRLNNKQERTLQEVLSQYKERHAIIQRFRKEYPHDPDLYQRLFGKKPLGRIEIITDPMTFYIKCFDRRDYHPNDESSDPGLTHGEGIGENVETPNAPEVGVVAMENTESILRSHKIEDIAELSDAVRLHEEQHFITNMFSTITSDEWVSDIISKLVYSEHNPLSHKKYLERYVRYIREDQDELTKSEILSHYREGISPEEISEILKDNEENSGYGYFELTDKKEKTKSFLYDDEPKDLTDETVEKVYGKEYQEMFKSSIRALDFLEKNGMSRDEIIALLIHEPLRSWPKVAKRVLEK